MIRISSAILLLITAAIGIVSSARGDSVPFKARVIVPAATVQSGPSNVFYPTDTLPEGSEIDVYREESNGWCAIRPPESSFSWVYGPRLKELENSLAEVTRNDVASRIGSQLNDKRNAVQIRLKRGEVVQILGEDEVDGQIWYRIAPPAGEFRWVHLSAIERIGPVESNDAGDHQIVTHSTATDTPASAAADALAPGEPMVAADTTPRSEDDEWRATAEPAAATESVTASTAPPSEDAAAPSPGVPTETVAPATISSAHANNKASASGTALPITEAGSQATDLPRQITDIELRLSQTVTGPPHSWNIESLEREAEQLLAKAPSPTDRDIIKNTLAKLDRFAAIQSRHARTASSAVAAPSLAPQTGLIPLAAAATSSPASTAAEFGGAQYDATGILRPVVSKRPGAPQYALVDDRGQVVSFVTPTPDVNLQPYLGHRVGIAGNRGFIPEFNRAHVTAGRVAPLSDRLMK